MNGCFMQCRVVRTDAQKVSIGIGRQAPHEALTDVSGWLKRQHTARGEMRMELNK